MLLNMIKPQPYAIVIRPNHEKENLAPFIIKPKKKKEEASQ